MSRIPLCDPADVPELETAFKMTEQRMGFMPNSLLIMAHMPELVEGFNQLAKPLYGPTAKLPGTLRGLIANISSRTAGCQYCVAHTASTAHRNDVSDEKLAAIWEYETNPMFTEAERAAMRFAQAAAQIPNAVTEADFDELKKHFSTREIVEIVGLIAFFGFLNRWNDTFATPLEDMPLEYARKVLPGTGWEEDKHVPGKASEAAE